MTGGPFTVLLTIGLVQALAVMSPGPSFLITVQTSLAQSRPEGVKVALGLGAGTFLWSSVTLLGLKLVFERYPVFFVVMKIAGAMFLLWIAWKIWTHATDKIAFEQHVDGNSRRNFARGFLTQISNPKVMVFFGSIFVAMLPPVIPLWMVFALVAIVTTNEILWYSAVALFFGSPPIRAFYGRMKMWIDRTTGLFLGALGVKLLWAARIAS